MARINGRLWAAFACVVLSALTVSAQQAVRPMKPAPAAVRSLINGLAVSSDSRPVPKASVRLRNLEVNEIEQTVTANDLGEFTFSARPEVPYVVEIADPAGRTVAVGDVIRARPGEVAGAKVTVPSALPALASVFVDTADVIRTAAAGTGLQVVDPTLPKVSPSR